MNHRNLLANLEGLSVEHQSFKENESVKSVATRKFN